VVLDWAEGAACGSMPDSSIIKATIEYLKIFK